MFTFTIRKKILVSFGILVLLLVAVGFISHDSLQANKNNLAILVKDIQPAVEQSLKIVGELDRASASLGFYLLSKEGIHKKTYIASMAKLTESVHSLGDMPIVKRDPETLVMVKHVEEGLAKLQGYKDQMIVYGSDERKNLPAMEFATIEVNPRAQIMLQSLGEMIQSESNEKANEERRQLLIDIYALRINFANSMNELRVFLAYRQNMSKINLKVYMGLVEGNLAKLNKYDTNMLTFEQGLAIENINKVFKDWSVATGKLIKIHSAEDWRQDAFVIRKELSPLVMLIQERLNTLVKRQQNASIQGSQELTTQVQHTQNMVGSLIVLGMVSALLIGWLLSRAITRPINALKESAYQLASGRLDSVIDTSRKDELGSLARRFSEMRDSIKKKIEDLRVLNVTGERMTSLNDPLNVLEHALQVMQEKTKVEIGSVYLYNKERDRLELATYFPPREQKPATEHGARTFKLGEGAAGRAAKDKQIVYIADTSKGDPYTTGPNDDVQPRAIICVPMGDKDEIFGVMNFSGKVGSVTFGETDREFAETIARMAVVSFKNIQLLYVIEEQNRTLEQKVEERTAQLRQKTNDINNMMQNMHQGIFTILPGAKIHPEYTAYLETIVESKNIADADVMELLFNDSALGGNALSQITAALDAILGEDAMMYDFNRHCLVREFTKNMPNGLDKIMEIDWDPILNESDVTEKLMVTVRDVTGLRGLQAEADKHKWELDVIGQILSVSTDKFVAFIKDAYHFADENERLIAATTEPTVDVVATLFRNMHTIKGNARTYGFVAITDVSHTAESSYDEMRQNLAVTWDKDKILAELAATRRVVQTYESIYIDKLSGNTAAGTFVEQGLLDKLNYILNDIGDKDTAKLRQALNDAKAVTNAIGTESMESILDAIVRSLPDLAQSMGKGAPHVVIEADNIRFMRDIAPVLKNVFTHSFRNAMDHGLESVEERKAHGKPDFGTITVKVNEENEQVVLSMFDDGRGLAVKKLKDKAIQNGLLDVNSEISGLALAELIFQSGMTTAENVSDISGRGVGMDAIRQFVEQAGGKVEIRFNQTPQKDSEFLPFVTRITLPAAFAKKLA